jgi:Cof subfamily protein (haloacid dehalogenase superfamily)
MGRKNYRMIAIDLDGTLLSPSGHVTPRAKQAVRKALDADLLVCFATGRSWTESRTVLDAVEHYDSAVFVSGAMVVDTKKQVVLHRTMMQPELARELSAHLEAAGHAVLAVQDTTVTGVDYLVTGDLAVDDATQYWMRVTSAKIEMVPRLADHPHEHTIRIGICTSPDEAAKMVWSLNEAFRERIICHSLLVPAFNVEVLEVFDPAVNKWEGVKLVAARHGIEPEQIVAIGDDLNDLPMIANAGLGVAMGNARPEVVAVAKRVIGTNAEEGLAQFLEELVETHAVEPLEVETAEDKNMINSNQT